MKNFKLLLMAMGFLVLNILPGCEKEMVYNEPIVLSPLSGKTYYCDKVSYCHGTIQSFVTLDNENKPLSLGVRISENTLKGLPTDINNNLKQALLKVPKEAKDIGIDHIDFGWNPQGHEPDPIYTLPHFDLHFYMISRKDQAAVIPGPDPIIVLPQFIPENYISGVVAVPNMGVHYVDVTGPEFNGSTFDKTYIYGFYQGKMIFWEPMFTLNFLLTKPDFTAAIKQPQSFQKSGYYPTTYRISFDADKNEYVVAVEGFKYH
ncbi:hypothetical protein [Daejeonella oryzae]|uniref:hypothetical protein n=1 Tax=Daejeonella oryzae TaxID=1122943 RepID=UPI000409A95D|nr:hypothetical protein [Daejeonella oryzae]